MVPVLDRNKVSLMPCSEKRAKKLMKKAEAIPYWQGGIFCIKLTKKPSSRNYQDVVLGVDPGSKREAYTVATKKRVVLNIITDTPNWVKSHMETRKNLRRARRSRKTPYRACRENRATLRNTNRIPPSTRARWDAKLRIIKQLLKILPITTINVEDVKAATKKGKKKWNASFSPLEVGKKWFYEQLTDIGLTLKTTEGYATKQHRDQRGFVKNQRKLEYVWETHNVDSHSLAEMVLGVNIKPSFGLYQINFLEYHRRQLHVQKSIKKNVRKQKGSTVSMGMSRGSVVKYEDKLAYLGGSSKGKVSIHSIISGDRTNQKIKIKDIKQMYITKRRVQFLPRLKPWVSLHIFSLK